jgi:alpha-methylacyl-CoA racemase
MPKIALKTPLHNIRILSLALNLPGPAALMRLQTMGALCTKVEGPHGDPMGNYSPAAYTQLHVDVRTIALDLKTPAGQTALHSELANTDVLITSFRPSALRKLQLDWNHLHVTYPQLSMVCIVGSPGARAEEPGHDLTYLAKNDLVAGLDLPATLYADMAGALLCTEAVLQAVLVQATQGASTYHEVALSDAAKHLALPRAWGLTLPAGAVGGAHAGYHVYACADGRVAVAALEPHFALALCQAAGILVNPATSKGSPIHSLMHQPLTQQQLAAFFSTHSCQQLTELAQDQDIPLFSIKNRL